jgi:hypothetical protein
VIERRREALDERLRHLELTLLDTSAARGDDVVDRSDLVGEVHVLERDHALAHAQAAELLAVVENVAGDC